jgi:serine O-acetyltransferase
VNGLFKRLKEDINAFKDRDPAARSGLEIFLLYPSVTALFWHRVAHKLYNIKLRFLARMISQLARFFTGIEIHPGAKIKKGCFIDHGMGVIIGETAEVGDGCTIYQGVTLGGTGKDVGKRHPTIGKNVMIGAGAKVLGPFTVGDNSKIAANAVVLNPVPPNCTCVGVPARVVKKDNIKVYDNLDQTHIPDPVSQELCKLLHRIRNLETELEKIKEEKDESL